MSKQFVRREERESFPLFLPRSAAGWCHLIRALRRSYSYENVKSERDPRLPCNARKKPPARCTGCFISARPSQSFEFTSTSLQCPASKCSALPPKFWVYIYIYIYVRVYISCLPKFVWNTRGCRANIKKIYFTQEFTPLTEVKKEIR